MTGMLITAAILWALLIVIGFVLLRQHRIDAGMHPRRGQRDEQRSGDVHAKRDGGGLPAGMVLNFHERSNDA